MSSISTDKLPRSEEGLLQPADRPPSLENSDRRAHPRLSRTELPGFGQIRLKGGPIVTLVDLSAGGVQIEMANHRLQPGAPLVVEIVGHDKESLAMPAQVLRCHVSALGAFATYRGALEFGRHLEVEQLFRSVRRRESEEHRSHVLTRPTPERDQPVSGVQTAHPSPSTVVSTAGLAGARAMIQSVSVRRGAESAGQMGMLLRNMTPLFEQHIPGRVVVESLLRSVRRMIPAATIQLLDAAQLASLSGDDAFYVDVPNASGAGGRKLFIEFPDGRLEPGHLDLLRLTAHLLALTDDMGPVAPSS